MYILLKIFNHFDIKFLRRIVMVEATNFIEEIINNDLRDGRVDCIQTRHPPEPSGYLHIGHVRNILLNYGTALKYGGVCNLRYDDTNPTKESQEFVDAIQDDVMWLGYKWKNIYYATDYFPQNYEIAVKLIKEGKAYVCDLTPEELSRTRGTLTEPGVESPYRNRSVEENLDLFERMKNGEFEMGERCLRAKIDMKSPNMNMRDPVIYRIQKNHHQRIGHSWNIYPSYDFSHPLDDALEGVSHSICGPEFEDHRPLYDWVIENSGLSHRPRQVEYSNLYIKGVVLGKRFIKKLVAEGRVSSFDDPRLFTIRGLKRRGVLPESLIEFVRVTGVSKNYGAVELSFFEHFVRDDLNKKSKRVMAVLDPVKLVITNMEGEEDVVLKDYPQNEESTYRTYKFGKELFIERSDFEIVPPAGFKRLFLGGEVRLMGAFIIKATGYDVDENGKITTIYAEYDKDTKSGSGSTKKVKGTIHWVNANYAKEIECRLINNLLLDEEDEDEEAASKEPDANKEYKFNPNSMVVVNNALIEADVEFNFEDRYQFLRNGYFALDTDTTENKLVFNRTITLKQ